MHVAIVGGGLAGLTAAHTLVGEGQEVTILDSAGFGGQIRTIVSNGFLVEEGAEGYPARRPSVTALCEDLGLAGQLLPQRLERTLALHHGTLLELRPGEAARLIGITAAEEDLGFGLMTLRDGMGRLIAALVSRLEGLAPLAAWTPVTRIEKQRGGWVVIPTGAPSVRADALVLAVPPWAVAALMGPQSPAPAVAGIPHASLVTVSMAWPREAVVHPLDATGFVVPDAPAGTLRACTFCSSKFEGRAGPDWHLLRAFFRPGEGDRGLTDQAWVGKATRVLGPTLGITIEPVQAWVARWPEAVPLHQDGGESAEGPFLAGGHQNFVLAGALFGGGGVDGAVRSGRAAAGHLLATGNRHSLDAARVPESRGRHYP
jgi:oxygen-dependent protoporphyrinogen oxidase